MAAEEEILTNARYIWDDPHLFKIGANNLLRRCVTQEEDKNILWHCHNSPCGGHYGADKTVAKVLQSGFFWPTLFKDAHQHVQHCDQCQRMGVYQEEMKCLYRILWRLRYSIVGGLIL